MELNQENLRATFLNKIVDVDRKKGKNSRMLTKEKYDEILSRLQALKSLDEKYTMKDYNYHHWFDKRHSLFLDDGLIYSLHL